MRVEVKGLELGEEAVLRRTTNNSQGNWTGSKEHCKYNNAPETTGAGGSSSLWQGVVCAGGGGRGGGVWVLGAQIFLFAVK